MTCYISRNNYLTTKSFIILQSIENIQFLLFSTMKIVSFFDVVSFWIIKSPIWRILQFLLLHFPDRSSEFHSVDVLPILLSQCMYERDVRARVVFLIFSFCELAQWTRERETFFCTPVHWNDAQIYGQSWFRRSLIKAVLRRPLSSWMCVAALSTHFSAFEQAPVVYQF